MISDEYRRQNELLHARSSTYGSGSGQKFKQFIREVMKNSGSATVLDYGCGKGTLKQVLGDCVTNYDPAVAEWSAKPEPADLVVCTDVLEHVEPEYLDDVIADLRRLTKKVAFIVIACRKANRHLDDGRNAHLIVEPPEWWLKKVSGTFDIFSKHVEPDNLMILCR